MFTPAAPHSVQEKSATQERRVKVLPPELVSRIAAGEVVERPASTVKELVENALDAGARHIHVELLGGGRELVRVTDDGHGMTQADLETCILPHATSKIDSADDLQALKSLGFRGEALPSIAAVSRFSITTRRRGCDAGWKIEITGGQPEKPESFPAASAFGTTVEARDLFFNLPAREKFLKGPGIEAAACTDCLLRLSLTRPDVAFTLKSGSQEIFSFAAAAPLNTPEIPLSAYNRRSRDVLGSEGSRGLLELLAQGPGTSDECGASDAGLPPPVTLSDSFAGYKLCGLISPPNITRPNRSNIYLTVNGRAVKDRTLTSALLESYRHLLPAKRYPLAVLFLELPDGDVDINVHPTKAEVRFRIPGLVYALLHHAVRSACGVPAGEAAAPAATPIVTRATNRSANVPLGAPKPLNGQTTFDLWPRTPLTPPAADRVTEKRSDGVNFGRADAATPERAEPLHAVTNPQSAIRNPQSEAPPDRVAEAPAAFAVAPEFSTQYSEPSVEAAPPPPFRILGQAAGSYIVLEDDSGVKLIDQHALHERILFEQLLARAEGRARGDSQGLLLPETLELSTLQAAVFNEEKSAAEILANLGFEVEPFGPRSILVRAAPAILKNSNAGALVRDILDALVSNDDGAPANQTRRSALREKAAYICSCKGAIKAGERINHDQMRALMEEYYRVVGARSFTCPHGRPLAVELSWEDLERGVGRR